MKLVHKATGIEVKQGDEVKSFRGETAFVDDWQKPSSPASSGRIHVVYNALDSHPAIFYPNVFDCEFIEREDRV